MDPSDKLNLQKMINANDVSDCTENIRAKCHSEPIRKDVMHMTKLKRAMSYLKNTKPDEFEQKLISECNFLFTNYTDIFNKVLKDEIDLQILYQLLDVLNKIERSKLDQHSGSFEVGKLLKKLYIDSALKKGEKLDKLHENEGPTYKQPKNITWKQYSMMQK